MMLLLVLDFDLDFDFFFSDGFSVFNVCRLISGCSSSAVLSLVSVSE